MSSELILREERPGDYEVVEELTFLAFEDFPIDLPDNGTEVLLVHKLRGDGAFVPALDFVAAADGCIVGNIMYSRSHVVTGSGEKIATLTFGPGSVLPDMQRKGIGSALINHTLELARGMGERAVIIFGHEEYYPRFGFVPAAQYGISTADGHNFDAFMALPLYSGALDGITGRYNGAPVFESISKDEADAFNARFERNA
jgi:predicted N-acetyltransferase YhbS